MPNYQQGKIYKLWCHETDDIYIGSTTQLLCKRLGEHKRKEECVSRVLFQKSNNVMIELIENYPCENKDQLTRREGELIRELDCINKQIPGRTQKTYYQDNRDKILEHAKQYRKDNLEEIQERQKKHYQNNSGEILERNKKYRVNNRDKLLDSYKEYYYDNRDTILEKNKEKYQENRDEIIKSRKEYRLANRDKINERRRELYRLKKLNHLP